MTMTFRAFDNGVLPAEKYWESASASTDLDAQELSEARQ